MLILPFILQLCAIVCWVFASFNLFPTSKVVWIALGLVFWGVSFMIGGIVLHPASHP